MSCSINRQDTRLEWFSKARFGMFIHWGVYSAIAKGEWYLRNSDIDLHAYMAYADLLKPNPDAVEEWVLLAKAAGMRYIVFTTKHHDGFCLFETETTPFNSLKMGPGRDMTAEFVNACRKHDMKIGFYFSLTDWSQTAFVREKKENFEIFLEKTVKAQIEELTSSYGKIDIWWYDGCSPVNAEKWQSEALNQLIRQRQPDIVINNRNALPGDFDTPEQHLDASPRMWETCMTLNDSWGYRRYDSNWKTAAAIIKNLAICSHYGGNFLLNVGPDRNGIIPVTCQNMLLQTGEFLKQNAEAFYDTERSEFGMEPGRFMAVHGNSIYLHKFPQYWEGTELRMLGIKNRILKAYLLLSGTEIDVLQEDGVIILQNLPQAPPCDYDVAIVLEYEGEPEATKPRHLWDDL